MCGVVESCVVVLLSVCVQLLRMLCLCLCCGLSVVCTVFEFCAYS